MYMYISPSLSIGEESTHLLEKISNLEQHRLSLLTELEIMKEKNNTFWETLEELVSHMTCDVWSHD